jgi:photosystem II stability/assembly factor-like uncharacterized protein
LVGETWITQLSTTTVIPYGISFADAANGTLVGNGGTILRTSDGGAIWRSQFSGTTNPLWAVSMVDANTATAVGNLGTILRTNTGGE